MRNSDGTASSGSMIRARLGCVVAALLLSGFSGVASAVLGPPDLLDSFDAVGVGVPACNNDVGGLAYDGTDLILSCGGSNVLERVSAASPHVYHGSVTITAGVSAAGLGALSWDPGRQMLWACDIGSKQVVLIDLTTHVVVGSPAPIPIPGTDGCTFGVAYDSSDDSLWVSQPGTIYHYKSNGTPIATISPINNLDGYPNSGIEVACGTLYLSNLDGGGAFSAPKDLSTSTQIYFDGHARLSDMAVDANTFAGVNALWVIDAAFGGGQRLIYAVPTAERCNESACVNANPRLGAATSCTVLQSEAAKVDINGPAGQFQGDVCIGPGGSLSMSGENFVTDNVRLDIGAKCDGCSTNRVHGLIFRPPAPEANLSAEISACDDAALKNRPPTLGNPLGQLACGPLSVKTLSGNQVITGAAGLNVVCVTDVNVGNKQVITLDGPVNQSAEFVFVVSGKFVIQGKILVSPNVPKSHVLYNVIGTGSDIAFSGGGGGVNCCNAEIDGSLIALDRAFAVSPGRINGQVCGGRKMAFASGSSVRCEIP